MNKVTGTMSDSDAILWSIGVDPVLRTTIVAVALLDRPPDWQVLTERAGELVEVVPRLKSRVGPLPLGVWRPKWIEDEEFVLARHLRRWEGDAAISVRGVLDVAARMAGDPFDLAHPLWEVVVFDLVGGGAALVLKFHHSMADGIGGLAVWSYLFDRRDGGFSHAAEAHGSREVHEAEPVPRRLVPTESEPNGATGTSWRFADLISRTRPACSGAANFVGQVSGAVLGAASWPFKTAADAGRTTAAVVRLLAPVSGPCSELMKGRSTKRQFEFVDLVPGVLRSQASKRQVTVNDLFLASVVTGLRRYHELHGAELARLRVLMPVSVRAENDAAAANRFVPVRFELPVPHETDICVSRVHEIAASQKHTPALELNQALALALDLLPARLAATLWGSMLKGDDVCASNVPGPPTATYVAGARIERMYAFAPPSGAALNISLLTFDGMDLVGINVDTAAVPDGSKLATCVEEGLREVLGVSDTTAVWS